MVLCKLRKMLNMRNFKDICGMVISSEWVIVFDMVDVYLVDSKLNKKVVRFILNLFCFVWGKL